MDKVLRWAGLKPGSSAWLGPISDQAGSVQVEPTLGSVNSKKGAPTNRWDLPSEPPTGVDHHNRGCPWRISMSTADRNQRDAELWW
ncbi:hypothetical protein V6N12_051317 [Hibiscus sabdariffa]|uniref:Uncharacterized protein n=1 Tax=Hibiscus sabdariffa TaxID=183260 RepID=A0ABR2GFK6_9ROSI